MAYVLAFGTQATATWNQVVVGVLVGILGVWSAVSREAIGGQTTNA